ncbi:hypothetical protein GFL62_31255 [Rhizobium leguminosarum bv. viciae]|nr:hypothetical protein [Rhizobium leguminosarum bv. viciae]TBY84122.1 hypothetical protein E0H32_10385 [Rhizobium leguminosarum bv. viciae]
MTTRDSLDAQPKVGLAFDAQVVALQPEGIEPGNSSEPLRPFAVEHSASPGYKGQCALAFSR